MDIGCTLSIVDAHKDAYVETQEDNRMDGQVDVRTDGNMEGTIKHSQQGKLEDHTDKKCYQVCLFVFFSFQS